MLVSSLTDSTMLRRGLTLLASNSATQALAFASSVLMGRFLGAELFGQYSALMAMVFVLGLVVEAGMEGVLTRDIAAGTAQTVPLFVSSLLAKGLLGGLVALLLALPPVASLLAPGAESVAAVQLAGVLVLFTTWNSSIAAVFRAWGRMGSVLVVNVLGLALQLAGVAALLLTVRSLPAIFVWFVAVQLFELALGLSLLRSRNVDPDRDSGSAGAPYLSQGLALLRRSWPFAVAGVLNALTIRVDLFVIEGIAGAASVGVYSVGTRLSDLLGLAPNSFFAALFPAFSTAYSRGGLPLSSRSYRQAVSKMALAGVVLAAAGLLLADVLVWVTFGTGYESAGAPLRLLSVMLIPLLVNRTTTAHLYATHREWRANVAILINLGLRGVGGLALVPVWGPAGAAAADLAAECVVLAFYWLSGSMRVIP